MFPHLPLGFPNISVGKESTCNAGDPSLIPGLESSTGEGIGYPLQYSCASLIAQLVKNPLQCRRPWFHSWVRRICWRRESLYTPVFLGFPGGSDGKESACNAGDLGSIPGLGRSPGEGKGYPLQYSGLENSMDRIVHGVTKSRTRLSDFHSFHFRHRVRGPQIARAPNLLILIKI